ncbi:MAG: V-type ATPase subunit [Clostridia bacterium]|nr:V-type ATPase subunit [Clostridia bacterium]
MSDYFYSSARVRALETGLLGREGLLRLAEAPSMAALLSQLEELGWKALYGEDGRTVLREQMLLEHLEQAFGEIASLTEEVNNRVFLLWRYPYDCNNLKAAIKCFLRNTDPTPMMFDFGTVSTEKIQNAVRTNDFSVLPTHLAQAAREATEAYAKNKNPQVIDLLLDRACYREMLAAAEESGVAFVLKLIQTKIDLTNLVMCIRMKRINNGVAGKLLLAESLLDGGTVQKDLIMSLFAMEERALWERLLYTDYKHFAEAMPSIAPTLTEIERAADNAFMAVVREARFISCGPEVLIGYLLGVESQTRNLRIIMAGKAASLPTETVMERIRESYV